MSQCPKCGAEVKNIDAYNKPRYECGAWIDYTDKFQESGECKDRQIAALQSELQAVREELAEFHKNWRLMKLSLKDCQKGTLHEKSLLVVLSGIIEPPEITEEDIEWGKQALAQAGKGEGG